MILLPEFSHTGDVLYALQPEAFERLVTSYYDTGVADDSLYVYQPLSFEPNISLTLMAKLLVAAMVVLPALVILGILLVVRRVRQRAVNSTANSHKAKQAVGIDQIVSIERLFSLKSKE